MDNQTLYKKAVAAMAHAYAPYSGFKVGAAVLTKGGLVYTGCNIENSSYGGTICAERTALVKAISEGHREIAAIAIANSGDGYAYPCGICRQFIYEFGEDIRVIVGDAAGNLTEKTISELLPNGFKL